TINYDFNEYEHGDLNLSNEGIYAKLFEEFPSYIEKAEYVEPEVVEEESDEEAPETTESNPDLFINKLGYRINTEDEKARAEIRRAKDRIYDEAISRYINATADKVVYLKYSEGSYIHVNKVDDLKSGGKTWFSGVNKLGDTVDGYILMADIDFKGTALTTAEGFSGKIIGNGHSLKNVSINISSKKIDKDTKKEVGLFTELDGAYIENLTIEGMSIKLKVNPGITVTAGALAAKAKNTELKNVKIEGLTIDTGKGDDGSAAYKIGDLFGIDSNTKLDNVSGRNITINASESAQVNRLLME
ncbi:MAG: hypothetical protein GX352_07270, partial [Clostridiales bacterium]|nr:hypothetical protein [Clostridiales bacterium]